MRKCALEAGGQEERDAWAGAMKPLQRSCHHRSRPVPEVGQHKTAALRELGEPGPCYATEQSAHARNAIAYIHGSPLEDPEPGAAPPIMSPQKILQRSSRMVTSMQAPRLSTITWLIVNLDFESWGSASEDCECAGEREAGMLWMCPGR